ncbi:hypothetical protein ACFQMF_10725 [Halorubrum rutilum]|uniref:Uncharacterized protein n=1 Tax=Halorubrum rutilum TaxID=1364933 RepID=A0ABD6ALC3_9EURY|nr:hypothetical protein [Halorubrum rutilum]
MPRAVLLACPVCDAVLAIRSKRAEVSKRSLRATAKRHLIEHELIESKAAIRKHAVAANAVEVIVSPEEYQRLPVDEWTDRDAAGIPDDAVSGHEFGSDGVGSSSDPAVETGSPRSASKEGPSQ